MDYHIHSPPTLLSFSHTSIHCKSFCILIQIMWLQLHTLISPNKIALIIPSMLINLSNHTSLPCSTQPFAKYSTYFYACFTFIIDHPVISTSPIPCLCIKLNSSVPNYVLSLNQQLCYKSFSHL